MDKKVNPGNTKNKTSKSNVRDTNETLTLPKEIYEKYNNNRIYKFIMFSNTLLKYKQFEKLSKSKQYFIVFGLERGCYNSAIDKAHKRRILPRWDNDIFVEIYNLICFNVSINLDCDSDVASNYLSQLVLENKIDVDKVGYMETKDMAPHKHNELENLLKERSKVEFTVKYTDSYKCYKCGMNQCALENRANCSADEMVNKTVICLNCHNEWNA